MDQNTRKTCITIALIALIAAISIKISPWFLFLLFLLDLDSLTD